MRDDAAKAFAEVKKTYDDAKKTRDEANKAKTAAEADVKKKDDGSYPKFAASFEALGVEFGLEAPDGAEAPSARIVKHILTLAFGSRWASQMDSFLDIYLRYRDAGAFE